MVSTALPVLEKQNLLLYRLQLLCCRRLGCLRPPASRRKRSSPHQGDRPRASNKRSTRNQRIAPVFGFQAKKYGATRDRFARASCVALSTGPCPGDRGTPTVLLRPRPSRVYDGRGNLLPERRSRGVLLPKGRGTSAGVQVCRQEPRAQRRVRSAVQEGRSLPSAP